MVDCEFPPHGLSGAASVLVPHLSEENVERLLSEAEGKSKRELQDFLVTLKPKKEFAPSARKIPQSEAADAPPVGQDRTEREQASRRPRPILDAGKSLRCFRVLVGPPRTYVVQLPDRRLSVPEWMVERSAADLALVGDPYVGTSHLLALSDLVKRFGSTRSCGPGILPETLSIQEERDHGQDEAAAVSAARATRKRSVSVDDFQLTTKSRERSIVNHIVGWRGERPLA